MAARQRGSSIFFQRLRPGFSALTAARIASRSASGRRLPGGAERRPRGPCRARPPRGRPWSLTPRPASAADVGLGRPASASSAGLEIAGGLVVGPDRGDEVAGRVLADPLVLVLAPASRRPRSWSGSGRPGGASTSSAAVFGVTPRALSASTSSEVCSRPAAASAWRRLAPDQDDPPAAPLDVRVPLLGAQRLEEPELLQLLQGRLEPPLQLGRRVRAAQADVLAGQGPQVEVEPRRGGRTACPGTGTSAWSSAAAA